MDKVKRCSCVEGDSIIAELRKNALVMRTSLIGKEANHILRQRAATGSTQLPTGQVR